MPEEKPSVKLFITTFIKAVVFIGLIVFFVWLFFIIANFVQSKYGVDLFSPAQLIGSIFVICFAVAVLYHRLMSLVQ